MDSPLLSVIIPTIDVPGIEERLKDCLDSLKMTSRQPYELILVYGVKGVAKAWNKGLEMARGNKILIANNDIIFPDDWETIKEHTDNAIVFPLTRNRNEKEYNKGTLKDHA